MVVVVVVVVVANDVPFMTLMLLLCISPRISIVIVEYTSFTVLLDGSYNCYSYYYCSCSFCSSCYYCSCWNATQSIDRIVSYRNLLTVQSVCLELVQRTIVPSDCRYSTSVRFNSNSNTNIPHCRYQFALFSWIQRSYSVVSTESKRVRVVNVARPR